MASSEQVARLSLLVEGLKVPPETIEKWHTKCDVDSFDQMTAKDISSLIEYCDKKILELSMKK